MTSGNGEKLRGVVIDAGLHQTGAFVLSSRLKESGQPSRFVYHDKGGWIQLSWDYPGNRETLRYIQVSRERALQAMTALAKGKIVC